MPDKYREGQKEYFGKKGMSLHVDCLFYQKDGSIRKTVYFTSLYRCDQDAIDVLSIQDEVLKAFTEKNLQIKEVFMKSDNAGCYHNGLGPEALYLLFKRYSLELRRYDFDEPSRGKDQCDRESSTAKSFLRSYVDSGKDLIDASNIFDALHFGSGVQNGEVCVLEIDKDVASLIGSKLQLHNFHSIKFEESGMVLWRYYEVGVGKKVPYSGVTFQSGAKIIKPVLHSNLIKM